MCGSTKRRSMTAAARRSRISLGCPRISAVTPRSAFKPTSSMASILAVERSPAPPASNNPSSPSSPRLADEVKLGALLERRRGAERQLGGGGGELPVREPLAARIDDEAILGAALRDIDVPALRRRAGEHIAGGGTGGAQALIERRGR